MAFRQRAPEAAPRHAPSPDASVPSGAQPCGTLARVLARVFREAKPEVLDLGPLCGESAVYLAGRGARYHVEAFRPPRPTPERKPAEPQPEIEPLRLDQPDGRFDVVLAWEMLDFVPPDRLSEIGGEIRRVLRDGGFVVIFSRQSAVSQREAPPRYRLLADDLIVRESSGRSAMPRYAHPTREIERAIAGLSVQGIHLQRSQMREIVAIKPGVG